MVYSTPWLQEVEVAMIEKAAAVYVLLIFSAIMISGCGRAPSGPESAAEIGRNAPDFTLRDLGDQKVSLSQFKGKIVLLDFWATWCGPCRMTMPQMESLQKKYPNDLVLLAVDMQEPLDVVREYVRREGVHSRVLLDEDGSVSSAYGVAAIPVQVLVDREGIVRRFQMGFDPRTTATFGAEIERLK